MRWRGVSAVAAKLSLVGRALGCSAHYMQSQGAYVVDGYT